MILTITNSQIEVNIDPRDRMSNNEIDKFWYVFLNTVLRNRGDDMLQLSTYDPDKLRTATIPMDKFLNLVNLKTPVVLRNYKNAEVKTNPLVFHNLPLEYLWYLKHKLDNYHSALPKIWPAVKIDLKMISIHLTDTSETNSVINKLFQELYHVLPVVNELRFGGKKIMDINYLDRQILKSKLNIIIYETTVMIWIRKGSTVFDNLEIPMTLTNDLTKTQYLPGRDKEPPLETKPTEDIEMLKEVVRRSLPLIRKEFQKRFNAASEVARDRELEINENIFEEFLLSLESITIQGISNVIDGSSL